jgi:hypothetical protein
MQELGQEYFAFYEGSEMIATVVPSCLNAFQKLEEREKVHWRQLAIHTIGKKCADSGQVAVVAGHFLFWPKEGEAGWPVYTPYDLDTFTQSSLVHRPCFSQLALVFAEIAQMVDRL